MQTGNIEKGVTEIDFDDNENTQPERKFKPIKIVVIGPASTGAKTSLICRFVKDTYDERVGATIGAGMYQKNVKVSGTFLDLFIWGLSNQQAQKSFTNNKFGIKI